MIYLDRRGFPQEKHGDQGDSAVREGLLALTADTYTDVASYESSWGMLCRSPNQYPWNNSLNFTRDQLLPLVAGLNARGKHDVIRRVFVMHLLRLGFCQDFQRDKPGTWKKPWPSTYINDHGQAVSKSFDFADPLLPNHWWVLIKGGKLWPLYMLYPFCFFFVLISILGSGLPNTEQNQIVSELSMHPNFVTKLYVLLNPKWNTSNYEYWQSRDEVEYAERIEAWIKTRL